jgi:putative transposase
MTYAFIADQAGEFAVSTLCRALDVSVSGYYAWRQRTPSAHQQTDEMLSVQIQQAFGAGRCVYGRPRIHAFLRRQGIRCGRKRIIGLMHAQGLCARRVRRRKPRTTDSQHPYPIAPNLLERDFTATAPNRKWVADITAIETQAGWLYLSGSVDTYSRRAIGYAMDPRRDEALVETAASDGPVQPTAPSRAGPSLGSRQPIHELELSGDLGEPGHCAE